MDVFDFSIQMEHDAESLYRNLASRTDHPGIKRVFNMLADDEVRHAAALEILKKKMSPSLDKGNIGEIKTVFSELKERVEEEMISRELLTELRRALEIEEKGRKYYKEKMAGLDTEDGKKLFQLLSRQEDYHYMTVDNLIELIERPQWWVENAEFNPGTDNYY